MENPTEARINPPHSNQDPLGGWGGCLPVPTAQQQKRDRQRPHTMIDVLTAVLVKQKIFAVAETSGNELLGRDPLVKVVPLVLLRPRPTLYGWRINAFFLFFSVK